MESTMKALVLEGVGEPLLIKQVPIPAIGEQHALVRLKAAAFNRRDYWIQKGQYAGLKFPIILGSDGAGVVAEVGSESEKEWIGKEVLINPSLNWGESEAAQSTTFHILGLPQDGTFAEYVSVPLQNLHIMPPHLTFEEAAAIPLAGLTAWRALFRRAHLKRGERLLLAGVGGGVASFALQWAVLAGAEVYVTSSKREKIRKALDLGAKAGALYTDKNWA